MSDFVNNNRKLLEEYVRLSRCSGGRSDYVQGGGGNTSVKLAGGKMAIKASGYRLSDVGTEQAYSVLDYQMLRSFYGGHEAKDFQDVEAAGAAQTKQAQCRIEGLPELRPSVEAGFHSILGRFVSHTHSVYANLACCTESCREILQRALDGADYRWGWVPYSNPGANLTFAVQEEGRRVKESQGEEPAVYFMQNHGLVVHHSECEACLGIQEDVNRRLAEFFGLKLEEYPEVVLQELKEGLYRSEIPFLEQAFRSGVYTENHLLYAPLCPDQMVFLVGTFKAEGGRMPGQDCCTADPETGKLYFRMSKGKAQVTAEVLLSVVFLEEHIRNAGYKTAVLGEAAQEFVNNWESEKYRKSLSGGAGAESKKK